MTNSCLQIGCCWNEGFILFCRKDSPEVGYNPQLSRIKGSPSSYKMYVARKFLIDGKYCNVSHTNMLIFKANEMDVEFFKLSKYLPAKKWRIWMQALKMLESGKSVGIVTLNERMKVLEYLESEAVPYAVAEKLSQ